MVVVLQFKAQGKALQTQSYQYNSVSVKDLSMDFEDQLPGKV